MKRNEVVMIPQWDRSDYQLAVQVGLVAALIIYSMAYAWVALFIDAARVCTFCGACYGSGRTPARLGVCRQCAHRLVVKEYEWEGCDEIQ